MFLTANGLPPEDGSGIAVGLQDLPDQESGVFGNSQWRRRPLQPEHQEGDTVRASYRSSDITVINYQSFCLLCLIFYTLCDFGLSQTEDAHRERNVAISVVVALKRWSYVAQ